MAKEKFVYEFKAKHQLCIQFSSKGVPNQKQNREPTDMV